MSTNNLAFEDKKYTIEELEQLEINTGNRYELIDGELTMMAGASISHGILIKSITRMIDEQLTNSPCIVVPDSLNIEVELNSEMNRFIPDVVVICPPFDINDSKNSNPSLVVEVTSKSTDLIDRTKKLDGYMGINGLKGYLIVDRYRVQISVFTTTIRGYERSNYFLNDSFRIDNLEFSVKDIYRELLELEPNLAIF